MKHARLYSDLLQALKGEPSSSGISTDGSLISASAVLHCGRNSGFLPSKYNHKVYAQATVVKRWTGNIALRTLCVNRATIAVVTQHALHASPRGLAFTWWGCQSLCLRHKLTELAHSFLFCSWVCFLSVWPHSGELQTQKLKSHLVRTQSLNILPLKPGAGQYIAIHAMLTARDFFFANFYPSGHSPVFFPKPLLIFSRVGCG